MPKMRRGRASLLSVFSVGSRVLCSQLFFVGILWAFAPGGFGFLFVQVIGHSLFGVRVLI
jgi:hypothetical protein